MPRPRPHRRDETKDRLPQQDAGHQPDDEDTCDGAEHLGAVEAEAVLCIRLSAGEHQGDDTHEKPGGTAAAAEVAMDSRRWDSAMDGAHPAAKAWTRGSRRPSAAERTRAYARLHHSLAAAARGSRITRATPRLFAGRKNPGKHAPGDIRKHVRGVRHHGQRVGNESTNDLRDHESKAQARADQELALRAVPPWSATAARREQCTKSRGRSCASTPLSRFPPHSSAWCSRCQPASLAGTGVHTG
eukprot:4043073-Prymnesium_polylepis.1